MDTLVHVPDINIPIPDAVKVTYNRYQTLVITSIITATIVLVSLAWSDVVQTTLNTYYPSDGTATISGKIYYATVITLCVILLQIYIFPYLQQTASVPAPSCPK